MIEIDNTETIDHEVIQTADQIITIITTDHKIFMEIETIIIQIDKETILSHHTEIIQTIKLHIKIIEALHLNTNDK